MDPWCLFSQLHSHNNSKIHLFQYLVWLQFIWQDLSHSHFQVPIKPSWTWGVGDTVRVHPEMRAATDWLSTDSLDVTLARDDQPRCLSWSEGLSLVVLWHGEMLGSYGHFQSLSHCAYWSEASYWFSSTQSSLDKFQARMMPCSTALRMFKEMKRMIFGGSS